MSEERRTAPLGLRLLPMLKAALGRAACDDQRSVPSMAEKILTEWLREHGYLKPAKEVRHR
jgi:hypothetical protein